MNIELILEKAGLAGAKFKHIHGGDINEAFCIEAGEKKYFLKINDALRYPGMFEKERSGLNCLREKFSQIVPQVKHCGTSKHEQYQFLEWLEQGPPGPGSWKEFGSALAKMHQQAGPYFGFEENNFIGNLPQLNEPSTRWKEFYSNNRIFPLVKLIFDKKDFDDKALKASISFCNHLDEIFPNEPPALLHGDLWSGNYFFVEGGCAAIYDPAVYYGHREMDLGMTKLFGGFHPDFYTAYQEQYPLAEGWEKRIVYSQLYPLLVHAHLFGGHYIRECRDILSEFL